MHKWVFFSLHSCTITIETALFGKRVVFLGIILSHFFSKLGFYTRGKKPLFSSNLRQTISLSPVVIRFGVFRFFVQNRLILSFTFIFILFNQDFSFQTVMVEFLRRGVIAKVITYKSNVGDFRVQEGNISIEVYFKRFG